MFDQPDEETLSAVTDITDVSGKMYSLWASWHFYILNSLAANDVYRRQLKYNRSLPMTSIDVNYIFNRGWMGNDLADLGNEDQTCKKRM